MTQRKYCAAPQEALQVRRAVPLVPAERSALLPLVQPEQRRVPLERLALLQEVQPDRQQAQWEQRLGAPARPALPLEVLPLEVLPLGALPLGAPARRLVSLERSAPRLRVLRQAQWERRLGAPALPLEVLPQAQPEQRPRSSLCSPA